MAAGTKFEHVPDWTYAGKERSIYTFFEAVALAGLEDKPIKLSADIQRTLLGFPVFGRREIVVQHDATIKCTVDVAFGHDFETAVWEAHTVKAAAEAKKQLRPATNGGCYFSEERGNCG